MNTVRVKISLIIYKDSRILLHKNEENIWEPPTGYLEMGETLIDASRRITLAVTGIYLNSPLYLNCSNDVFSREEHYLTVFMMDRQVKQIDDRIPTVEGWQWLYVSALPKPLCLSLHNLIDTRGLHFLREFEKPGITRDTYGWGST